MSLIRVDNANDASVASLSTGLGSEAVARATADTAIHAVYKPYLVRAAFVDDTMTTATRLLAPVSTSMLSTSATTASSATFYLNATELAVSGLTTKLNLQVTCNTNATAIGTVTFNAYLYSVTSVAGGADASTITLGSAVSGSNVAFVDPGTSTSTTSTSGDFNCPASGLHVLVMQNTAQPAADSRASFTYTLRYRHV